MKTSMLMKSIQYTPMFFSAFWSFLRPHTITGTTLGSLSILARAVYETKTIFPYGALVRQTTLGLLALLCGNGYIVGINQIYDVDIDKVNKPYLPIAAKNLSTDTAWFLVISLAAIGTTITSKNFGALITVLYLLGLFLGTIYSIPPFRLKQFAIPAALIIATVRGFLLNFGVYYSVRSAFSLPFQWSPAILFITCFVTLFALAIAVTKDLADVKGDKHFCIKTFATRLGVQKVSTLGVGMLLVNYTGAIALPIVFPEHFHAVRMVVAHVGLASKLLYEAFQLHKHNYTPAAINRLYSWVWKLLYAEYILLPFI